MSSNAEGLNFAGGGSAGAGAQTGIVQSTYAPPQGPAQAMFSPVFISGGQAPPTSESTVRWNATLQQFELQPTVGANAAPIPPVSNLVAMVNGPKIEGVLQCRTESYGHMTRCKGLGTVKAAENLAAGELFAEIPAGFRPNSVETLPWAISGSGAYIEIKIAPSGVITLSLELKATEAVNLTGLEFFGF